MSKIDWSSIDPDTDEEQDHPEVIEEEKLEKKNPQLKQQKQWKFTKIPKEKIERKQIQQKRLDHKMEQLKILQQLERDNIWIFVFRNPNPELIKLVQSFPSSQTINSQMGWDLLITKDQAKKLFIDGFGQNKVFGRMQIGRKNYDRETKYTDKYPKNPKYQQFKEFSSNKQFPFQKKKRNYRQIQEQKYRQKESIKLKYREKSKDKLQNIQTKPIINQSQSIVISECKGLQCDVQMCKLQECKFCTDQTLADKSSSQFSTSYPQFRQFANIQNFQSDKSLTQELLESKSLNDTPSLENTFTEELLCDLEIPCLQPECHTQIQQLLNTKQTPDISLIQDFSTIQLVTNDEDELQQQQIDFQLSDGIASVVQKAKKKKRVRNKNPKEKKISNNPFDRLR